MTSLMDILNAGAPPSRTGAVIPDGTTSAAPVAPMMPPAQPLPPAGGGPGFFDTLTPSGPPMDAPVSAPSSGSSRFASIAKQLAPIIGSLVIGKKAGAPAAGAFLKGYLETHEAQEAELQRQALVDEQAKVRLAALNDSKEKELTTWLQDLPVTASKITDPAAFASFMEIADTVGVTRYKLPKGAVRQILGQTGPAVDKSDVKEASELIKTIGAENLQRGLDAGAVVQFRGKQVPLREVYALSGMPTDAKGAPVIAPKADAAPPPGDEEGRYVADMIAAAEETKGAKLTPAERAGVRIKARREYSDGGRKPEDPIIAELRLLRLQNLKNSGSSTTLTPAQARMADSMADNFFRDSKDFIERSNSYGTVMSAAKDPSAAGDLSLIFAFMKMLDPGSVVREGEFATAQNSAGVPDRIRNAYNKAINGERLNQTQRTDFLGQAKKIYETSKRRQDQILNQHTQRAKRVGLPPEQVVMDYGVGVETSAPARVRVKLANGQTGTMDANEALPAGAVIIK